MIYLTWKNILCTHFEALEQGDDTLQIFHVF